MASLVAGMGLSLSGLRAQTIAFKNLSLSECRRDTLLNHNNPSAD